MNARLSEPDYQLVWPRSLFVAESSKLLNVRTESDWDDRCLLLLTDAFVGDYVDGPTAEFGRIQPESNDPWSRRPTALTARQKFLKDLMTDSDLLHENPPPKRPYWRDRQGYSSDPANARWSIDMVAREFAALVHELDLACYLDRRFGIDCEEESRGNQAAIVIERELGLTDVWPLYPRTLADDPDLFYTLVEFLHDCVARPRKPVCYHAWNDCGWHREEFDIETGRAVYRWRVNKLFDRSDIGLRMADEGEDVGRLVTVTDDARAELVEAVVHCGDNEPTTDQVRHALALFRDRSADRNQKRSAVAALALVLEERRHDVLTDVMTKTDRGALFEIANGFHIRHQRADQKRDYPDYYLDWVFWLYLSSIELTNRRYRRTTSPTTDWWPIARGLMTRADGAVPSEVATVVRAWGVRDVASGLALAAAPAGAALRAAVAVRVVSDFGDAAVFGLALPDAATKAKVAGVAVAWGVLCAYSGRHTG